MGLLDYFDPDTLRGKLKGLLGGMPISRMARGDASVSMAGLNDALMAMPVGPYAQGAYEAAMSVGPLMAGMTKWEKAHKIAQKNAAKPVEKGGLGLPPNNTAADRAKALGFTEDAYHGTIADPKHFVPRDGGAVFAARGDTKTAREIASKYAGGEWTTPIARDSLAVSGASESPQILPLLLRGADKKYIEASVKDPRNIRSRFAAFDPARVNEADILAAYFGFPMPQYQQD